MTVWISSSTVPCSHTCINKSIKDCFVCMRMEAGISNSVQQSLIAVCVETSISNTVQNRHVAVSVLISRCTVPSSAFSRSDVNSIIWNVSIQRRISYAEMCTEVIPCSSPYLSEFIFALIQFNDWRVVMTKRCIDISKVFIERRYFKSEISTYISSISTDVDSICRNILNTISESCIDCSKSAACVC